MSRSNPFAINPSTTDHSKTTYLRNWRDRMHELYLNNLAVLCERSLEIFSCGADRWPLMTDDERSAYDGVYAQLLYQERRSLDVYLEAVVKLQQHLTVGPQ